MKKMPTRHEMVRAFREKDGGFDGVFYVGVRTTGVFCRPVCRARPAKEGNMEFFGTVAEAAGAGYRPCKLCRPLEGGGAPALVKRLMAWAEEGEGRVTEEELKKRGVDPSTARRQFRRYFQMSYAAYQRSRRMGAALAEIGRGKTVMGAQVGAGYASGSGFREARARLFEGEGGKRAGKMPAPQAVLWAKWMETPLGRMVGVCSEEGVVLVDFVDRRGLEKAMERLRRRFGEEGAQVAIVPGEHRYLQQLAKELGEYFTGERKSFTVKVCLGGSAFERAAWEYLRTIPYGQTRTYLEEARGLENEKAVRAVGRANGMNFLEIVVPCHRVVASSGELAGYGGGVARKRWLLAFEKGREGGGK